MRELAVYDGNTRIGTIKIADDGTVRAMNRDGKRLGSFASIKEATAAFNAPVEPGLPQR